VPSPHPKNEQSIEKRSPDLLPTDPLKLDFGEDYDDEL
jgi:hypothetical protein